MVHCKTAHCWAVCRGDRDAGQKCWIFSTVLLTLKKTWEIRSYYFWFWTIALLLMISSLQNIPYKYLKFISKTQYILNSQAMSSFQKTPSSIKCNVILCSVDIKQSVVIQSEIRILRSNGLNPKCWIVLSCVFENCLVCFWKSPWPGIMSLNFDILPYIGFLGTPLLLLMAAEEGHSFIWNWTDNYQIWSCCTKYLYICHPVIFITVLSFLATSLIIHLLVVLSLIKIQRTLNTVLSDTAIEITCQSFWNFITLV